MSKTTPNAPAFPVPEGAAATGLTKREWFAGQIMAGIYADVQNHSGGTADFIGECAVVAADELIKELNKDD